LGGLHEDAVRLLVRLQGGEGVNLSALTYDDCLWFSVIRRVSYCYDGGEAVVVSAALEWIFRPRSPLLGRPLHRHLAGPGLPCWLVLDVMIPSLLPGGGPLPEGSMPVGCRWVFSCLGVVDAIAIM
jgi:hypothetical protein